MFSRTKSRQLWLLPPSNCFSERGRLRNAEPWMISQIVPLTLPIPWDGQQFSIERLGAHSFLVGPNGSGKSRFANALKGALPNARLLGTVRLEGMSAPPMSAVFGGDNFKSGYQKSNFWSFPHGGWRRLRHRRLHHLRSASRHSCHSPSDAELALQSRNHP